MAKLPVFEPPPNVYAVRKRLANGTVRLYWYHQPHRNDPARRKPATRLPEPNTPEWFAALAGLAGKPEAIATPTVDDLWHAYSTGPTWPEAAGSQRLYRLIYRAHIQPSFGASAISAITAPLVVELRDSRAHKPQTANMILSVISAMWTRAIEKGWATQNVGKVSRLRVDPKEARPVSPEAWAALTHPEAPMALRRFAYLARGTGQRISDILTMRPSMREDDGIRHAVQKLGKADHWSPVRPDLLAEIDGWRAWKTRPYMHVGNEPMTDVRFRRLWDRWASDERGKALADYRPHDLRATCVCDDRLDGLTELEISVRRCMDVANVRKYSRHINQKQAAQAPEKRRKGA
jgi:hypothetical protein